MMNGLLKWWTQTGYDSRRRSSQRAHARLSAELLESRTTPAIINVGAAAPGFGAVYDDGVVNPVTQLANGEYLAADLSDAIGFVNTLPPQGGSGGPADPVGPHLIYVNVEFVFLTERLPTLVPQTIITGNSAVTTVFTPEDYYPQYPNFAPTPVVTKAVIRRGDFAFQDELGNPVGDFRILDTISSWLELKHLVFAGGRETLGDIEQHRHGGLIQFNGINAPLVVDNCQFLDGYAIGRGGAIYSPSRGIEVTNSYFYGNRADSGGAIWMVTASAQPLIITGTRFDANLSMDNGGTIFVDTLGVVSITSSGFTDTYSLNGYGGSLYVLTAHTVNIDKTFFDDTTAVDGGAIYIASTLYFYVNDSLITNCYDWNFDDDAIYAHVAIGYAITNSIIDGEVVIV
jgi:hypothetical protein